MPLLLLLGACLALAGEKGPAGDKETVSYLRSLQTPGGGFLVSRSDGKGPPDSPGSLGATGAAVRALKYRGGTIPDREACLRFVRACQDPSSGGFADRPGGTPGVIPTAVGLMTLVDLGVPRKDFEEGALRYLGERAQAFEEVRMAAAAAEAVGRRPARAGAWREMVLQMRNPDGTFGKGEGAARETAGAVVTLLRLGAAVEERGAVVRALKAAQRPDGGFGKEGARESDLESCYRVLRAFAMLKEKPADPDGCRRFVARCRNADGGYGLAPGQASGAPATYFASAVLHWLGEDRRPLGPRRTGKPLPTHPEEGITDCGGQESIWRGRPARQARLEGVVRRQARPEGDLTAAG